MKKLKMKDEERITIFCDYKDVTYALEFLQLDSKLHFHLVKDKIESHLNLPMIYFDEKGNPSDN